MIRTYLSQPANMRRTLDFHQYTLHNYCPCRRTAVSVEKQMPFQLSHTVVYVRKHEAFSAKLGCVYHPEQYPKAF